MIDDMDPGFDSENRAALERRWMELTRVALPAAAGARGWPIRLDHCFQRVFLDHAFGGRWTDLHAARPAYRTVPLDRLAAAVALAESVLAGREALAPLDGRSRAWRRTATRAGVSAGGSGRPPARR